VNKDDHLWNAASIAHYAFGAACGASYGLAIQPKRSTVLGGVALGSTVWLLADQLALPLLNLSKERSEYPARKHVRSALLHGVYGLVVAFVYRQSSRKFDRSGADGCYSLREVPLIELRS
jgi:hypothetical protein